MKKIILLTSTILLGLGAVSSSFAWTRVNWYNYYNDRGIHTQKKIVRHCGPRWCEVNISYRHNYGNGWNGWYGRHSYSYQR